MGHLVDNWKVYAALLVAGTVGLLLYKNLKLRHEKGILKDELDVEKLVVAIRDKSSSDLVAEHNKELASKYKIKPIPED